MYGRILSVLCFCIAMSDMACDKPSEAPAAIPVHQSVAKAEPEVPPGAQDITPDNGKGSLHLPGPSEPAPEETHTRHRYELPPGATNVRASVQWADPSWTQVKLALGTGICPHRGKKLAEIMASGGAGVVEVQGAEIDPQSAGPWFLHINADSAAEAKAGQTLEYTFRVFAW